MIINFLSKNENKFINNFGISIVMVLILVAIIMIIATISIKVSSDESEITNYDLNYIQAKLAAETGIIHFVSSLSNGLQINDIIFGTLEVNIDSSGTLSDMAIYETKFLKLSQTTENYLISSVGKYINTYSVLISEIDKNYPFKILRIYEANE